MPIFLTVVEFTSNYQSYKQNPARFTFRTSLASPRCAGQPVPESAWLTAQLDRTSQSPKSAFVANVGPDPEETVVFVGTGVLPGKPVSAAVLETATAAAVACLGSIEAVRAISVSIVVHKKQTDLH
jgi:hypothetical protein